MLHPFEPFDFRSLCLLGYVIVLCVSMFGIGIYLYNLPHCRYINKTLPILRRPLKNSVLMVSLIDRILHDPPFREFRAPLLFANFKLLSFR